MEKSKLNRALNKYFEDTEVWTDLNTRIYNFLLAHCTVGMRETMRGLNGWDVVSLTQDIMRYHELLKGAYHGQEATRQVMAEVDYLEVKLYTMYQFTNQSVDDYVYKYLSVVDSIRITGVLPGYASLAYVLYGKSIVCDHVNALNAPNREIAVQPYHTSLLFRRLNKQRFS